MREFFAGVIIFITSFLGARGLFIKWGILPNLIVACVVTLAVMKLWQWRREGKEFKKLGVRVPEERKEGKWDYVVDPAFSDDPANVWYEPPFES